MGKVTRLFCWHQDFVHKGLSAAVPGPKTCGKTLKNVYKIKIQRDLFETCNIWSKWLGLSVDIKSLSPRGFLPLTRGYIYMYKIITYIWWNMIKMYIKSDFKAICFKPATNGQSDKGFLLTSKVCPQGVVCHCPGTKYIYKIIRNVYKIRLFFFKLATNGQSEKGILLTSEVCPQGLYALAPGL